MDLVSIITPAFNCSAYIKQTIESVLSQTYTNFELIIIDDFSSDDTVAIVKSFSDKRIVLVENTKNYGAAYCRNKGLEIAKGNVIAFLDGDDIWDDTKLEKQLKFMNDNNYSFSYTNYSLIDEKGTIGKYYFTGPERVTHKMFVKSDYVGCLTVMFKKAIYPDLEIPVDIKKRNDYALWLKVSTKSDCYLLNECLASYRKNASGLSGSKKSKLLKYHEMVFKKVLGYNSIKASWCALRNVLYLIIRRLKYRKTLR